MISFRDFLLFLYLINEMIILKFLKRVNHILFSGKSLPEMKALNMTCASFGLSLGTICPAPFTETKVSPLNFQTIPAI